MCPVYLPCPSLIAIESSYRLKNRYEDFLIIWRIRDWRLEIGDCVSEWSISNLQLTNLQSPISTKKEVIVLGYFQRTERGTGGVLCRFTRTEQSRLPHRIQRH